ncbi:MAG: hypothetical protein Kow00133_04270 [Amphiplicatus sp.]
MMKFIASSLDAAKAKARRALGENAAILAVRNLPSGDVEVSASDRPAPAAPLEPVEPGFADETRHAIADARARPAAGARLNERLEQRFAEDALARLRGELTRSRPPGPRLDLSDRVVQGMSAILRPHGIGEALLAALVDGARAARIDDDLYRMEAAFASVFTFAPIRFSPAAPLMLVGPTGAGKTSSAAKLAAAAIAQGQDAFIMTADAARAGAVEQLKTYSNALGADYYIVETPFDVDQALKARAATGAILLDTPGVSPFDSGDVAALRSFQEACRAEPVLVLPASGDAAEFRDWAQAFREFGVRRVIVTKFDASKRVGAALDAVHAAGLGLAHFSETPFISDGLLDANADFLARRLLASAPGRIA